MTTSLLHWWRIAFCLWRWFTTTTPQFMTNCFRRTIVSRSLWLKTSNKSSCFFGSHDYPFYLFMWIEYLRVSSLIAVVCLEWLFYYYRLPELSFSVLEVVRDMNLPHIVGTYGHTKCSHPLSSQCWIEKWEMLECTELVRCRIRIWMDEFDC